MKAISSVELDRTTGEEPERRGDERSETPRSGGSFPVERLGAAPVPDPQPDPEVPVRQPRRRFTAHYKVDILRKADACTQPGEVGALLRKEGLYSSHLVTWRRQRAAGLTPKKRGRKTTTDSRLTREKAIFEATTRRLERRLQRAEAVIAFQKKISELLQIPLKPFVDDEID